MKYRKRPELFEAFTFDEFVEFGKKSGANIVGGIPWSFEFLGHPVTHENDNRYIIGRVGTVYFDRGDVLVVTEGNELHVCNGAKFAQLFEPVPEG